MSAVRAVSGVEVPSVGIWVLDPGHAEVAFVGRHFGLTKVRGRFTGVAGTVAIADDIRRVTRRRDRSTWRRSAPVTRPRRPPPLGRLLRRRRAPDSDVPLHRRSRSTGLGDHGAASSRSRASPAR